MTASVNRQIGDRLEEAAVLLEQQQASPFRVSAYRRAAGTLARLDRDVGEIIEADGMKGLVALPGIGRGIANAIVEMVAHGRWSLLDRLRGELDPVQLFQSVPGLGPELAKRIHENLHVDTLEALEVAAHDGRLDTVPGVGRRRATAIRNHLSSALQRVRLPTPAKDVPRPSVTVLLSVDAEYRNKACANELPTIAPKRFNPEGKSWLPVMHVTRDGWHFSALFSNTARAHELHRTHDWVVVYYYDDEHHEGQHTVVTETRGPLTGQRVVRGRESECRACYRPD
ncbi:MAG TPA: helix-hairpin-helix domain-containing protein [Gammaproteobacteria bacterium]